MKQGCLSGPNGVLITRVRLASRWWQRMRGLLFRKPLAADGREAMLIAPCNSVHTCGMTYPLDVIFMDRQQVIVRICEHVAPWRVRLGRGAHSALELHAGAAAVLDLDVGDSLLWLDDSQLHADTAADGQLAG